jgi:hypothetical protein
LRQQLHAERPDPVVERQQRGLTIPRLRRICALVAAGGCLCTVTACGGIGGLDGNVDRGNAAGINVTVGQPADFTGFIVNHSGRTITLRSATLLAVKGQPAPELVHLAVELGHGYALNGRGWPADEDGSVRTAPFVGHQVRNGERVSILYSVVTHHLGVYADAGVRVTVTSGRSTAHVNVSSAAATCVVRSLKSDCPSWVSPWIENAGQHPL